MNLEELLKRLNVDGVDVDVHVVSGNMPFGSLLDSLIGEQDPHCVAARKLEATVLGRVARTLLARERVPSVKEVMVETIIEMLKAEAQIYGMQIDEWNDILSSTDDLIKLRDELLPNPEGDDKERVDKQNEAVTVTKERLLIVKEYVEVLKQSSEELAHHVSKHNPVSKNNGSQPKTAS